MIHRHRRAAAVAAALALAAVGGGCSDDDGGASGDTTTATVAEEVPPADTVPTTEAFDPSTVDVAAVQDVIDAIDASYGAMVRRLRDDGGYTPESEGWLDLLYGEPALRFSRQVIDATIDVSFANLRDDPQGPDTTVNRLVSVAEDCIYIEARRSYEPVVRRVIDESQTQIFMALRRADTSRRDPADAELPPWRLIFEGRLASGDEPENPCE